MAQNTAGRILTETRKFDHITHSLASLHWCLINVSSDFQVLLMASDEMGKPLYTSPMSLNLLFPCFVSKLQGLFIFCLLTQSDSVEAT